MPVRKVGADCWQWGKSGKVYCGPNAKQKAHAQERAAYANGFREPKKKVSAAESKSKKPDTVKIRPSEKGEQSKYTAVFYQDENKIKTTHFGWRGMSDFTKHKDPERKQRYLDRHKKNENWNDPMSAHPMMTSRAISTSDRLPSPLSSAISNRRLCVKSLNSTSKVTRSCLPPSTGTSTETGHL